ncbi:NAD-dependent epimerase/dehydratase family protein [Flammeovirga agarivorans]|uniref:NAD-dependent epimerase/dehydratase family protein n=1 Tax=Flammeovirga agarivorans TaxID=2726742 RepID=A0A7X8XXD3_9BACT|nr:NAD-dependent epimerase/dehydratase family protein [Flammeovirga agarivorans]NLR93137.1 NAD-dependent epimerase/dehydratase family protein [Flammeovirga agarivorans]
MKKRTALIIGSTGLIGNSLVQFLVDSDHYEKVISIGRRNSGINHPKLSEVITNLDDLHELVLEDTIDDAFCCLGTTMKKAGSKDAFYKVDHEYVMKFAQLASKLKAKTFNVVSAMGANKDSLVYYNRVKGQVENELIQLNFNTLNIYQPSLLLGDRKESRFGEDFGKIFNSVFNPLIPKKYKGIEGIKVAKSMITTALSSQNQKINYITSDIMQSLGV